jgi:sodium/bile acid cotransporter 7
MRRLLLSLDKFTLALLGTVLLATVLPCYGWGAELFSRLTTLAIGLLFFLQGARLSREAVMSGLTHWRLHVLIACCTFIVFPAFGLLFSKLAPGLLSQPLWLGVLFLCVLPSTVQSSIAFTSIGRGNVPAAICSATASNIAGIVITPFLVGLLLSLHGAGVSGSEIGDIVLQLLVPFLVGHLLQKWIKGWVTRNKRLLSFTDRGSVLLTVYTAFSHAVIAGIWKQLPPSQLGVVFVVDAVLLAAILLTTTYVSRASGFSREDEVTIVFCGSKKTLISGIPMANILFAGSAVGLAVLPLMIFHQMQLMVCAWLARRYAARAAAEDLAAVPVSV